MPDTAVPVLKRDAGGTLFRLWPAPGPNKSKRQKMTVDWGTFSVHNRVFEIVE